MFTNTILGSRSSINLGSGKATLLNNFYNNINFFKITLKRELKDEKIQILFKKDRILFRYFKSYKAKSKEELESIISNILESNYNLKIKDVFIFKNDIDSDLILNYIYKNQAMYNN